MSLKLTFTATVVAALLAGTAMAYADDVTGEIKLLTWQGGGELDTLHKVEAAFVAKHPGVSFKEVIPSGTGHPASLMRTVLAGGEPIDLMVNTWPWFREELAASNLLRPIDDLWKKDNWDQYLTPAWKALGQTGGVTYGIQYNFGNRSAFFYLNSSLSKAGVTPPKTWDDLVGSFPKFKAAGITPIALAAKDIGHTEIFATLLDRVGGVEAAQKLAAKQMAWTDPIVKTTMEKWKSLFDAGAFPDSATALGTAWDNAADATLKQGKDAYLMMFNYAVVYAHQNFNVTEGTDFNAVQFPSMGLGHDDTSVVEAKEMLSINTGKNEAAADAFLDFLLGPDASNTYAKDGFAVPSSATDTSNYGVVVKQAADVAKTAKLSFVLADTLGGEMSDEFNAQMQKFVQTPTDATIDTVLAALEAKAQATK